MDTGAGGGGRDVVRCQWARNAFPDYEHYHDVEWGVPVHDDRVHFEFLLLEGAQAGLSWATILKRRAGYRVAFAGRRAATGRLDAIVPSGDPRLPGLTAIFVVDNAAHTLRSGVVASVEVPYPEAAGTVFEVPVRAVVRRGGLAGVYLVADGRARLAWCSIDPSTEGETAVVLDGLGEGDVVVADASVEGLRDARRVEAAF